MKTAFRRILSLVMVFILITGIAVPSFAEGTVTPTTGTVTMAYLGNGATFGLTLAQGTKNFTINRSDITVTKGTAGAKLVGFRKSNQNTQEEWDNNANGSWSKSSTKYYNYHLSVRVASEGNFKISYKIGDKSYSIKVNVVPYKNPIKSITLTGVNNGKNFASLTKNGPPTKTLKLASKTNDAKLKVTTASGWVVRGVTIEDTKTHEQISRQIMDSKGGYSSLTLYCDTLKTGRTYNVMVTLWKDTKSMYGSTMGFFYTIKS